MGCGVFVLFLFFFGEVCMRKDLNIMFEMLDKIGYKDDELVSLICFFNMCIKIFVVWNYYLLLYVEM